MIILHLVLIIFLLAVLYLLMRPMLSGAIYFPTSNTTVEAMIRVADVRAGQLVIDLGSGDGRILIAAARRGAHAEGYEVNPILVWRSRRAIRRAGLAHLACVYYKSLWRADVSRADVVMLYAFSTVMRGLWKKLSREMKPGAAIVSNAFVFQNVAPVKVDGKVRLYKI